MPSRWDLLLEQKPRPIVDHLLDEVARLLARELEAWPPPVESLDLQTGAAFASVLEPRTPRPSPPVYREAFRLARWELERELPAMDDYMRNQRYLAAGLAPGDKPALLFLSRWLTEQMLGLLEATENRLRRPQLVVCLENLERRLFQPTARA